MVKLRSFTVVVVVLGCMTAAASASTPPPVNIVPPGIVAPEQLTPGNTLQATPASWGGDVVSYSYQWLRCDADGQACAPVPGATGRTYQLTDSDVGHAFRIQQVAYGADGTSASGTSDPTVVVAPFPPVNTARPLISGQLAVGAVLRETPGTWSSTAPVSFSYQWYSCKYIVPVPGKPGHPTFAPCKPIPGETKPTYTVRKSDTPGDLYATVTATNAGGSYMTYPATYDAVGSTSYLGPGPGGVDPLFALPRSVPSVPWMLSHGGVTGYWRAPRAGHLDITWTAAVNGKSVLVAKAHTKFRHRGRYKVTTRLTKRGRAAFAHNYLLGVAIAAAFTPAGEKDSTESANSLNLITF